MNIRPKTALDYLIELINSGMEFPNAAYKAATTYKVDQPTLESQYDNEHQTFPR